MSLVHFLLHSSQLLTCLLAASPKRTAFWGLDYYRKKVFSLNVCVLRSYTLACLIPRRSLRVRKLVSGQAARSRTVNTSEFSGEGPATDRGLSFLTRAHLESPVSPAVFRRQPGTWSTGESGRRRGGSGRALSTPPSLTPPLSLTLLGGVEERGGGGQ